MAKTNIDDQIAKAKERLKRLEKRKTLDEAKQAIADRDKLLAEVKNLKQSLSKHIEDEKLFNQQRSQLQKLLSEINNFHMWSAKDGDKNYTLIRRDLIVSRVNEILNNNRK